MRGIQMSYTKLIPRILADEPNALRYGIGAQPNEGKSWSQPHGIQRGGCCDDQDPLLRGQAPQVLMEA